MHSAIGAVESCPDFYGICILIALTLALENHGPTIHPNHAYERDVPLEEG